MLSSSVFENYLSMKCNDLWHTRGRVKNVRARFAILLTSEVSISSNEIGKSSHTKFARIAENLICNSGNLHYESINIVISNRLAYHFIRGTLRLFSTFSHFFFSFLSLFDYHLPGIEKTENV